MAVSVVGVAILAATAVSGKDIGGDSNGKGHRQQSTNIGSKDTVGVATAMETAAAGAATTATGSPTIALGINCRQNHLRHHLGGLWVLVVMVVCGIVCEEEQYWWY
jgi:hypothetical protein